MLTSTLSKRSLYLGKRSCPFHLRLFGTSVCLGLLLRPSVCSGLLPRPSVCSGRCFLFYVHSLLDGLLILLFLTSNSNARQSVLLFGLGSTIADIKFQDHYIIIFTSLICSSVGHLISQSVVPAFGKFTNETCCGTYFHTLLELSLSTAQMELALRLGPSSTH